MNLVLCQKAATIPCICFKKDFWSFLNDYKSFKTGEIKGRSNVFKTSLYLSVQLEKLPIPKLFANNLKSKETKTK